MSPKNKIKTPLFFTVFFVLVTFTFPMGLYAGPPNRLECPCFSEREVSRWIAHSDDAYCYYENNGSYTETVVKWHISGDRKDYSLTASYVEENQTFNHCDKRTDYHTKKGEWWEIETYWYPYITPDEAALCFQILDAQCTSSP